MPRDLLRSKPFLRINLGARSATSVHTQGFTSRAQVVELAPGALASRPQIGRRHRPNLLAVARRTVGAGSRLAAGSNGRSTLIDQQLAPAAVGEQDLFRLLRSGKPRRVGGNRQWSGQLGGQELLRLVAPFARYGKRGRRGGGFGFNPAITLRECGA